MRKGMAVVPSLSSNAPPSSAALQPASEASQAEGQASPAVLGASPRANQPHKEAQPKAAKRLPLAALASGFQEISRGAGASSRASLQKQLAQPELPSSAASPKAQQRPPSRAPPGSSRRALASSPASKTRRST
ncbi:translation initiation factor IF-2-like [Homalodisca vitripennis]|uniref:translation initiation factor IF-2-like n=1 Tax=Homalodisca vitripennis TaxID=197043 RepID=UPI001EEAFBF7|nr:translation initiation factor IF-2-like [Homalodisca vitripennis]